jgi:hypothetical protein
MNHFGTKASSSYDWNCWTACKLEFFFKLTLLVVCLITGGALWAQTSNGRIMGSVTDQTGGTIANAKVTVTDTARGLNRVLTTTDTGEFNAPGLLPGTYTVKAEAKGFRSLERNNVLIEVGQEVRVDMTLQPGEQEQTITVTEAVPLVETTNATLGGTLSNQTINDLPLNGRNFQNLLELRPGVMIYPGGSGWTQSSNGMRAHDNVYMVEGVNSSDPWMAQSVMNAVMASGDAGTILPIDAIQEFKTEQNPRAEFGWKPGAIVNVGIKSGTNAMHGTAFAFGRDTAMDARNVFQQPPTPKTPVELEQFGGSLGGPILKDKLFYFGNFESQRYSVGSSGLITDPVTATNGLGGTTNNMVAACQAALLPGGGGVAPLSAQLVGLSPTCVPLSNYPGLFPANTGTSTAGSPTSFPTALNSNNTIYSGLIKVNYHLSDKNSISGMYFISPGEGILNDSPNSQTSPAWLTNQYARSQAFSADWTWTPNSAWVNEARFGYSHYYQVFQSQDATQDPSNYPFNGTTYHYYSGQTNPAYFGFPGITVQPYSGALGAGWPKTVGPDGVYSIVDQVSILRGNHSLKFGGELLDQISNSNVTANTKGPIRFGSLKSYFNGIPNRATFLTGNLQRRITAMNYALFIQDDWRIRPRLTVNLGLRYEIEGVEHEKNNLLGNFDPTLGLVQAGGAISSPYKGDHNNFAPRVGFAWDMFGNGKTVLRGGAGVIFEQLSFDVFNGVGNAFGLRTNPTGAALYACPPNVTIAAQCQVPSPGNIAVANIAFTGTALTSQATPGAIAFQWLNNGPNAPLYNPTPACGDGNATLPTGFKPPQCNVLMVDQNLRTPYVTAWNLGISRAITNNVSLDVAYVGNHGTKLISVSDINQTPSVTFQNVANGVGTITTGAGWTAAALANCAGSQNMVQLTTFCAPSAALEQSTRPFSAQFPYLKWIQEMYNSDASNYNGLQATLTMRNYHGLSMTSGYTYSHALGYNSDQGTGGGLVLPINSYGDRHSQMYSSTTFDQRHRWTLSTTYNIPGKKGYGQMLEGWSLNATARISTGTPWGVIDATTDFSGTGEMGVSGTFGTMGGQWNFLTANGGPGNPSDFLALHNFANVTPGPIPAGATTAAPGVPFFPGNGTPANPTANAACNSAVGSNPLARAALAELGCYALGSSVLIPPAFGSYGVMPRNPWRDQGFRTMDFSVTKAIRIVERLNAQFRAEFFNVLNHPNFVNPFGGPGGNAATLDPSVAGGGSGLGFVQNTPDQAGSNPVLGSGGPRSIQLGLKLIF